MTQKTGIFICLAIACFGACVLLAVNSREQTQESAGWDLTIQEDSMKTQEDEEAEEASEQCADQDSLEEIYVYVCGSVKHSGVYCVPEGARLADVIDAAGGFSKRADKEYLNLAQKAQDGQQVYVPSKKEKQKMQVKQEESNGKVNLNTASKEEFMTLAGIGEAKADAILAYREEHGAFSSIEEIMQISGIKEGVYQKICDSITIS